MKKYLLFFPALALGAAFALSAASTPAGACSYMCLGDMEDLSAPTVVVLEGDPDAEGLDWSGAAFIEAHSDGTVYLLNVGDEYYYAEIAEIAEEVE